MDEQNKLKELNALQSLSSSPMILMICILTGVLTILTAMEDFTNATSSWVITIGIIRLTLNVLLITSLLIIYFDGKKLSLSTIGFQFFKVVFLLLFIFNLISLISNGFVSALITFTSLFSFVTTEGVKNLHLLFVALLFSYMASFVVEIFYFTSIKNCINSGIHTLRGENSKDPISRAPIFLIIAKALLSMISIFLLIYVFPPIATAIAEANENNHYTDISLFRKVLLTITEILNLFISFVGAYLLDRYHKMVNAK
ncbi:MAG: hypothetical protein K5762_01665 [Bacilli bacterium]|nr:hypothetical protein [Bacilli bacterium]